MDLRNDIKSIIESQENAEGCKNAIDDYLRPYLLEPDEVFAFRCRGCGKCCKNRDDLILTARDLFNIAKKTGMRTEDVIDKYCDLYTGRDSRLPIVLLLPVGSSRSCPFLTGTRCSIHDSKPAVCAIFPLGRIYQATADGKDGSQPKVKYLLQPTDCASKRKKHTVRSWLAEFGLTVEDPFYFAWNEALIYLTTFILDCEKRNVKKHILTMFSEMIYVGLYARYDTNQDFMPQFQENVKAMKSVFDSTKDLSAEQIEKTVKRVFRRLQVI